MIFHVSIGLIIVFDYFQYNERAVNKKTVSRVSISCYKGLHKKMTNPKKKRIEVNKKKTL